MPRLPSISLHNQKFRVIKTVISNIALYFKTWKRTKIWHGQTIKTNVFFGWLHYIEYTIYLMNILFFYRNNIFWIPQVSYYAKWKKSVKKTIYCMISFIWKTQSRQIDFGCIALEDLDRTRWRVTVNGHRVFLGVDESVLCSKIRMWQWLHICGLY